METHDFQTAKGIDSDRFAATLRRTLLDPDKRTVLLAKLDDSLEARDQYTLQNANGLGRIRVFKNYGMHLSKVRRCDDAPVPLLRGHPRGEQVRTQVFQLAGCNWRCWYCFVDDALLSASIRRGQYVDARQLIDLYLAVPDRPHVLDLSGGQPDLVPEWAYWVLKEVDSRGLRGKMLIWQDDNLSSEMMWKVLDSEMIQFMASFEGHSRVGCFKGFDAESFAFNTSAPPELFDRQFKVFQRLLDDGFDLYAYATFTCPDGHCCRERMKSFVDRLQQIDPCLPLRTIPLRIKAFSATRTRMTSETEVALDEQSKAGEFWDAEMLSRFTPGQLQSPYESITLRGQKKDSPRPAAS